MSASPPPDASPGPRSLSLVDRLAPDRPVSRAEKTFRKLVGEIERTRAQLAQWRAYERRYAQRVATEFEPLQAQLHDKQREMALLIDELLSSRQRLRRIDRVLLQQILQMLLHVLAPAGPDDPLTALHDKYSDSGRETQEAPQRPDRDVPPRGGAGHRAAGRREPAARQPAPSLRALFRRLASALHPDREPDPAEKARKNGLMQQVNQAYETGDLLTLLMLQREHSAADPGSAPDPDLLAQYNHTLRGQLQELESEMERVKTAYMAIMGYRSQRVTVSAVDRKLTAELNNMRAGLADLKRDLVRFRDPAQLRASLDALAHHQLEQAATKELLAMMELHPDGMADLFAGLDEATPRRRRRRRRR